MCVYIRCFLEYLAMYVYFRCLSGISGNVSIFLDAFLECLSMCVYLDAFLEYLELCVCFGCLCGMSGNVCIFWMPFWNV